jgi:hypothetical protein
MGYLLLHRRSKVIIKRYATLSGARTGMRVSNKNSGWARRASRCFSGFAEQEWCTNGPDWDYAPYILVHDGDYFRLQVNA